MTIRFSTGKKNRTQRGVRSRVPTELNREGRRRLKKMKKR